MATAEENAHIAHQHYQGEANRHQSKTKPTVSKGKVEKNLQKSAVSAERRKKTGKFA